MTGQQQRFIADIDGAVVIRVDHGRDIERTTIAAAEHSGRQPLRPCGTDKGENGRGLAGASNREIPDTDDRHRRRLPPVSGHATAGDLPIDEG